MSNKDINKNTQMKNLLCRDTRASYLIDMFGYNPFKESRGSNVRRCTYGDTCRGAHSSSDIQLFPHVYNWEKTDKSKFDFIGLHKEISSVISRDKVKLRPFNKFSDKINKFHDMDFISLIQLWHDLSCHYRKISKEIPKKKQWKSSELPKMHDSGYIFSEDVPGFYLNENSEDPAWAFERLTHLCVQHYSFKEKISKREPVLIWDLCLGEHNCKEGCHFIKQILCQDDFYKGKCDCVSLDEFTKNVSKIKSEIDIINKTKHKTDSLLKQLKMKENELNNYQRKTHYTDCGMIPYNEQLKKVIPEPIIEDIIPEKKVGKVIKISLKK